MPLELVTGPANAEKAGHVLSGVRRAAQAGPVPLLVVPTRRDVDVYRRELAGDAVALGVAVMDFDELLREMARRADVSSRSLGLVGRERVAAAVADALAGGERLRALTKAATTGGFPAALARFCGEIAQARCDPRRFARAMSIWGASEHGREAFAADLARLYGAYVERLERIDRVDPAQHGWLVLDALRLRPAAWGATPVFLYGFDDLAPIQLDAVRTLAANVGAQVTVSLPFEARAAFAGRGQTRGDLAELAGSNIVVLPPSDRHYADASRTALHGLERTLFESVPASVDPGATIELLEGGDPRAELELIAERVRRLLDGGQSADGIALALRDVAVAAPLAEAVFAEAGIEVALELWRPLHRTALGRGLLALLRCALLGGGADDLLVWLRAPGAPGGSGRRVDSLEASIRERGLVGADGALEEWARLGGHDLTAISRLREARARGRGELFDALLREAARMLAAPHREGSTGTAPVLGREQVADAAALWRLTRLLDELRDLEHGAARITLDDEALCELIAEVEVPIGGGARPGAILVTDPLALRARRVDVLFLGRMQEGVFPRSGRPEPFLGDDERRSIDHALAAAGEQPLRLRVHEDQLDAERYQLYAAVSRPRERLIVSWHRADEDGEPVVRSPFVDDLLAVFAPAPQVRDRRLGSVGWLPRDRVSSSQRALSDALSEGQERLRAASVRDDAQPLSHPDVRAMLAARDSWSATELEVYARCPVRWFVERLLRPGTIEPDAEPLSRGRVGHAALERTLRELAQAGQRLDQETLEASIARLRVHLRAEEEASPISSDPRRRLAESGRLEADLIRYLEHHVEVGSSLTPSDFELSFGVAGTELPAVDLGVIKVKGRIDRIDRSADRREAIIVDYKGRAAQAPAAKWLDDGLLQAGLYSLALEQLEQQAGTRVVGALYQPVGAEPRLMSARGFVEEGADATASYKDRLAPEDRDELLDAILARAGQLTRDIRAGVLEPSPERCSWNNSGCAYPSICRCEA